MSSILERIRLAELEAAWRRVSGSQRVLELGGRSGYQAKLLHEWGNEVTSVDVEVPEKNLHYPVCRYDGRHLPFPDAAFDVVFSSNVLEHVVDVPGLMEEAARVLRPSGVMIHVLPSTSFRFWTNIVHYAWVFLVLCRLRDRPEESSSRSHRPDSLKNFSRMAWRAVVPQAHGVYANALWELYTYSIGRWRRVFQRCGMRVEAVEPAGVYYSGYQVLGSLDVPARKRSAKVLGSSCNIFVLHPIETRS